MTNNDKNISKKTEDLLSDEDIRNWFQSRDPNRKKSNPFLTDDAKEQYTGKASKLKIVGDVKKDEERDWGVSYSEHQRHLKQSSKNFMWIGINGGLLISILLVIIIKIIIM